LELIKAIDSLGVTFTSNYSWLGFELMSQNLVIYINNRWGSGLHLHWL